MCKATIGRLLLVFDRPSGAADLQLRFTYHELDPKV
jgi:hypothetical protein